MPRPRARIRTRPRLARAIVLGALSLAILVATSASGPAASSNVTVTLNVMTATELDASGCATGTAATSFGTVQPGTGVVTPGCTITFGSTNGETYLRAFQSDTRGTAMYRPFDDDLDTGFGTAGAFNLDNAPGFTDKFWDATELRNGDIQLVGHTNPGGTEERTLLVRLQADGTPRTTFGTNGVKVEDTAPGGGDLGWSVVSPGDDSVYVGVTQPGGEFAIGRWLADGNRDGAWGGGDGWAELPDDQLPRNMVMTPDGFIYVGGTDFWPATDCAVTRFQPNGVLDTTYGVGGTRHLFPAGTFCDGMGVQRDGTVLMVGALGNDAALAQLTPTGTVDPGFLGGAWTGDLDGAANSGSYDAIAAPDGTWIIGGGVDGVGLVSRMRTDGTTINSFDGNGHRRLTAALSNGVRALGWIDGRIVAGGVYGNSEVHRLLPSGAPDTSFSDDGFFDPAAPATLEDNGLLLMGDGRLFIYGDSAGSAVGQSIMLDSETIPDHDNADFDWNDGSGMFGICISGVGANTTAMRPTGACTAADDPAWGSISSWDMEAQLPVLAMADDSVNTSTATIHFGVRVPSGQKQGSYIAPITFDVVQSYPF